MDFQSEPSPSSPKKQPADSFSLARLTAVAKASSDLKATMEQPGNEGLRFLFEDLAKHLPEREQFKLAFKGLAENADQRQVMLAASLMQNPRVISRLRDEYCQLGGGVQGLYFNLDNLDWSIKKSEDFDKALLSGGMQRPSAEGKTQQVQELDGPESVILPKPSHTKVVRTANAPTANAATADSPSTSSQSKDSQPDGLRGADGSKANDGKSEQMEDTPKSSLGRGTNSNVLELNQHHAELRKKQSDGGGGSQPAKEKTTWKPGNKQGLNWS